MSEIFQRYGLRRVINVSGTETAHGASPVADEVITAVTEILPHSVEMIELQRAASSVIARVTGAEAGCVVNCAAAGITVGVAACMAGDDLARIEQLPDTTGMKDRVVMQKGHVADFSASTAQMVRISGARVVEVGTATDCAIYQLRAALDGEVAAALYVVSHHTVQGGLLPLERFCEVCHDTGVPVIVDAAAEYDWAGFLAAGADLVTFSVHKVPGGLTAGVLAGRKDLVRACHGQQFGLGRPMKAGKEGVVGAIAALELWQSLDHESQCRETVRMVDAAAEKLADLTGLRLEKLPDVSGQPVVRLALHLDPAAAGLTAHALGTALAAGDPKFVIRTLHADRGYLLLDVRRLDGDDLDLVCGRIRDIITAAEAPADDVAPPSRRDVLQDSLRAWPEPG